MNKIQQRQIGDAAGESHFTGIASPAAGAVANRARSEKGEGKTNSRESWKTNPSTQPGRSEAETQTLAYGENEVEWLDLHQHIPAQSVDENEFRQLLARASRMAAKSQRSILIVRLREEAQAKVEKHLKCLGAKISNYYLIRNFGGQRELRIILQPENAARQKKYAAALQEPLPPATASELAGVIEGLNLER